MKRNFYFILVFALALFFSACGGQPAMTEEELAAKDEKDRFISATIEVTCMMMQSENIMADVAPKNRPKLNDQINAIFKKHGFDTDDVEYMEAVAEKYGSYEEVFEEVGFALQDC
jgi:cytochrome c-type biogenesis protein CcmH/NrfF